MIRSATPGDAEQFCEIYNYYVRETTVTFEEEPVSQATMEERMAAVAGKLPWLAAEVDGTVAGYAYATTWKPRAAYRYTVECAIYLDPAFHGHGLGARLYGELIKDLRGRGVHCVIAGVSLPNPASDALHEKLGFEQAGRFREVGNKHGRWLDVGYWILLL